MSKLAALKNMSKAARPMRGMQTASATPSVPPSMASMAAMGGKRKQRSEGDISSVFASLSEESAKELPPRFLDLKREIIGTADNQARLTASWGRLISRLAQATEDIQSKQQTAIPILTYDDLMAADPATISRIKECGTLVLRDVIPPSEAEAWLEELRAYIKANPEVKGFPADDKQVFELYWSKPQLAARSHPRSVAVQRALLNLFSTTPDAAVSHTQPLMYCDRLRIRHPGDARFALGPHVDGGSIERWEDPMYRSVYDTILKGKWEEFDAFQMGPRALANQNLYDGPGACGVFRAFQGWTSLSQTGPGEGTLRVYPYLREMTAYTLLRPLFKEKASRATLTTEDYLSADNWEIDLSTTAFPGAPPARGQEYSDATHPHLNINRTMVSVPRVGPGDQAWWHADVIHSVESVHAGTGPSAVMYIPTVPLTAINASYVRDQRDSFEQRIPPPDFPGGVGESSFKGTGVPSDIVGQDVRRAMGLEAFEVRQDMTAGERQATEEANKILGF